MQTGRFTEMKEEDLQRIQTNEIKLTIYNLFL